jgi:hypothetical protein
MEGKRMAATRRRFDSDGERRLYSALVKVYGPHSVQGHVGMGDVVASEGIGLSDAELRYLGLAHFDLVIRDAKEGAVAAWEYDGAHHIADPSSRGETGSRTASAARPVCWLLIPSTAV